MSNALSVSRRHVLGMAMVLCALVCGFALWSAPAGAEVAHKYLSQLTGFGEPTAIAFDAAGDVYVVDQLDGTVDRFNATGAPLSFPAREPYVNGSKLTGDPSGNFSWHGVGEQGVAVNDENGDVYVTNSEAHVVDVFSSSGEYLSQLTGTPASAPISGPLNNPDDLAFDQATHDLYVTDPDIGVVDVFSSTGAYVSQFGDGVLQHSEFYGMSGVAVNDLTGDAYVADSNYPEKGVYVFGSAGNFDPRSGLVKAHPKSPS